MIKNNKNDDASKKRTYLRIALYCVLFIALICFLRIILFDNQSKVTRVLAASTTTISVDETKTGISIPSDFLGFSMAPTHVCNLITHEENSQAVDQLFKNLGPTDVRVIGDTADWQPTGTQNCNATSNPVFTTQVIDNFFTIMKKVNWKVLWGINFSTYDPTKFASEANYVYSTEKPYLLGIEIGNEPNNYVAGNYRKSPYGYSQYKSEWEAYYTAIKKYSSAIPISSPDFDSGTDAWLPNFLQDEHEKINMFTEHVYPAVQGSQGVGVKAPTITNILSQQLMDSIVNTIQEWSTILKPSGLPLVIDESNSVSSGGVAGVSNTLAASLWATDYLFTAAQQGVRRLDFFGVFSNAAYSPISYEGVPNGLYYAFLLFHEASSDGGVVVPTTQTSVNVVSHAVVATNGTLHVVIINKSPTTDAPIVITTQKNYLQATAITLKALTNVADTSGFTLGGSAVAKNGTWTPVVATLRSCEKSTSLTVAAGTAALVTFSSIANSVISCVTPPPLVGDFNHDGAVDILDYNILRSCYGLATGKSTSACSNPSTADPHHDGIVDGIDYNIWLRAFIGSN